MNKFNPNWVSAPGETIQDIINEKNINTDELQKSLNINNLECLLSGTLSIDRKLAEALARHLGASAEFWLKREEDYRRDKKRLENQ